MVAEVGGQEELDGGLDVLRAEGALLLVADELGGLERHLLEHVGDERVDDAHALLADADVVGDALQHLVDVEGEGLEVLAAVSLLGGVLVRAGLAFSHFGTLQLRRPFILAAPVSSILLAVGGLESVAPAAPFQFAHFN